jgi:lipopolysaccharide biosynthesis protein
MADEQRPAVAAFYLPQFHPIEENDRAWGPGFTEWHNVARGRPRFRGHQQPVLPTDLGFYDLRLPATRVAQQELARAHGIDAFCWYHYWFDGRRLLHEPFDGMLADPDESLPFLLCWANESWTRNWSGHSGEVIVEQRYSSDDDEAHIRWLVEVFADPRYVRVDGRPVLLVYQASELPEPTATTDLWRRTCVDAGVGEPLLLAVSSFRQRIDDPALLGFDGVVEQQPDLNVVRPAWRAATRYVASRTRLVPRYPAQVRFPYDRLVRTATARQASYATRTDRYPTVCSGWDNSPRRRRGATILTGTTPELYAEWLSSAMRTAAPIVFVNAWNEWAEGAHLEPDDVHGRAFLEATAKAVSAARAP